MKKIILICFMFVGFIYANAQTGNPAGVVLSDVTVSVDTTVGANLHKLYFSITITNIPALQSVELSLVNASGTVVSSIGNYTLAGSSATFYYLNSPQNGKKTVMAHSVSFMKSVDAATYSSSNSVKLRVTATGGTVTDLLKVIPKNN